MKRKTIFVLIIFIMILITNNVCGAEIRISEEELQESSNIESTVVNRETAVMLLATEEEVTVLETWDISATEEDNVTATLYSDGTLIISGNGNMKDYDFYNWIRAPWYDEYKDCIKQLTINGNIENIGWYAFKKLEFLEKVELNEGLKAIETEAFSGCKNLKEINFPNTLEEITYLSFCDCINLEKIKLPGTLRLVGERTFLNCKSLKEVIIEEGLEQILFRTFEGCNIEEIILPNSLKKIEAWAFRDCKMSKITIPANVNSISGSPFYECKNLVEIIVDEKNPYYQSKEGILYNEDYTELICYPAGKNKERCEILAGVTTIARGAFYGCSALTEIVIPNSVITMEREVFDRCNNLESINVYCGSYAEEYVTQNYNDKLRILHTYEDIAIAPTCTEQGYRIHTCTRCNDSYVNGYTETLGHNYGEWVIDKEPTYEEEGHKYRICTNCNTEKEEQVIPKLTEEQLQVKTTYTVKEQDGQKYAVMSNAKEVQEILSNITSNKELEIVDKSGNIIEDTTKVGTGAKVVEKQTKEVVYTIVIKGDTNGDAKVDFINDVIGLNNYRLSIIKLDTASILAGDINEDGKVDFINDIIGINNYRLGITNSL